MLEVFCSIKDAKEAGFEFYDRAPTVFLVRKITSDGELKLAVVQLTFQPDPKAS